MNAAQRNFRLQKGSPAIGAGVGGTTVGALEYPNVYYVDPRHPAATDEPAWGYPAVPLATLAKACAIAQPGETIVLRGGVYRETLRPRNDGVTIRAMTGERVILSGADLIEGWTRQADGRWSAPLASEPKTLLRDGQAWHDFAYDAVSRRIVMRHEDPRLHVFETVVRRLGIDLRGRKAVTVELCRQAAPFLPDVVNLLGAPPGQSSTTRGRSGQVSFGAWPIRSCPTRGRYELQIGD